MPRRCLLFGLMLVLTAFTLYARAVSTVVWQDEAEKAIDAQWMRNGAAAVDDPLASGGKAVRMPWQVGSQGVCAQLTTQPLTLQGKCLFTFYLRGEEMLPLSDGMLVSLIAYDQATGGQAYRNEKIVYGINLKSDGYTAVTLPLDTATLPATYRSVEVGFTWQVSTAGCTPVLYLDKASISSQTLETPVITEVWPSKVRYAPGEKAGARITLANPTKQDATVTLTGEERWGLTGTRKVLTQKVLLKAGETKEVNAAWALGKEEYGREIAVNLLVDGKTVDTKSALFSVSKLPLWNSTGDNPDLGGGWYRYMPHVFFYVQPASDQESWKAIKAFKRLQPGGPMFEYFSWSGGDIADLSPTEEPFSGNEGRMSYRSKANIKHQISMLKSEGFWPVTYVNGTVWADSGYKLFAKHPEWFLYDANGEVGHYESDKRELYRRHREVDFDVNTYPSVFFQAVLNHSLPEVQEYIAQQFIKASKEMGFNGVRFDVRYLEVYPGEYGFDGKEIATTKEQADLISVANVKRVKQLVRQELPEFTFGYNYASPDETNSMMKTMQERCADGGWMLDEVSCSYQEKTSPYHYWSAYARRMTSWGDQVNKWDGIYNPFDFRRGGGLYVIDNIYSSIFRLIAGGRFICYYNSRLPYGQLGQFATRYSEVLFGADRDWLPEIKGEVDVQAAAPLWWKDMVYWNRDSAGHRQLIVHLVNPPKIAEVEENPRSEINPPVTNITVTCAPVAGKAPTAAYLLMAEPMEPTGANEMKMLTLPCKSSADGKVTVTVPSVIFWKTLVFVY